MPATDRVLVTGGTGKTGRLVAELLRADGVPFRSATRSRPGPDEVHLDWALPATFAPALDGVSAVYLVAPTDRSDHITVMRPFLEEAVDRNAGPLVLLSASSLPEGASMMGEVHAWLHANAPRWTALRPSWFMQNFTTQHLPGILTEGRIYSATENGRVGFIDASDIAAVAVKALTADLGNGDLVLTGPKALSYDDVAVALGKVVGRNIVHVRLAVDELAARHERHGLPNDYARLLAGMDAAVADGAEDRTTDVVEQVIGRPPRSLDGFLSAQRAIFA